MGFRKPFRAVPVRLGPHHRREEQRRFQKRALHYLVIAAAAGVGIGIGSVALTADGRNQIASTLKPVTVAAGITRAREPQAGDYWRRCDDARAAGTAPIYAGEPGYRDGLDGDSDGIACEPYHGW